MMDTEAVNLGWLGYIVLGLGLGSLFLIMLGSILGKPRKPRVTLVFIGMVLTLATITVAFTWLIGAFLSIFVA